MKQLEQTEAFARTTRVLLAAVLAFLLAATQVPATAIAYAAPAASERPVGIEKPRASDLLAVGPYVEHEAIALVRDGASLGQERSADAVAEGEDLASVSAEALAEAPSIDATDSGVSAQNSATQGDPSAGAHVVLIRDESKSTAQLLEELLAHEAVITAEPNYLVSDIEDESGQKLEEALDEVAEHFESHLTENAALPVPENGFALMATSVPEEQNTAAASAQAADGTRFQWGNSNLGTFAGAGTEGIDINYDDWNTSTSSAGAAPVVAILDSGIDGTHPDLKDKLWNDVVGLAGTYPGADEHGFSTSDYKSTEVTSGASGHGTHVAGIVGAAWDGMGTSGVSEAAQLMSVRHNDTFAGIFACFDYLNEAQKKGVNIAAINASLGVGGGTSSILDAIIAEIGLGPDHDGTGAITLFAAGNSGTNVDDAADTGSLLSENPYVVIVDSADANGGLSAFSNYGPRTTDFAAPGSANLSTWPTVDPSYSAELDSSPAVYESFEDGAGGNPGLVFNSETVSPPGTTPQPTTSERAFDGDKSLLLNAAERGGAALETVISESIDISCARANGDAQYLSIRFAGECFDGSGSVVDNSGASLVVSLVVKDTASGNYVYAPLESAGGRFQAMGGSWGGASYTLPDTVAVKDAGGQETQLPVDYADFVLAITGTTSYVNFLEQVPTVTPAEGRAFVDAIGIGSNLTAYRYEQGTSMATPEAAGVAAVVAQQTGIYGQELAARLRGSTTAHSDELVGTSLSGGMVDAQKALENPGPAITTATLSGDGATIDIEGYYFGDSTDNLTVTVDGANAPVEGLVAYGTLQTVKVKTPEGFAGGQVEIAVTRSGGGADETARAFPYLSPAKSVNRFPHSLAVPQAVAQWDKVQLAGWNGCIWAAPQISAMRATEDYAALQCYRIASNTWETVVLPGEVIASVSENGSSGMVAGMGVSAWKGKLAVLLAGGGGEKSALWTLDANGTWTKVGVWEASGESGQGICYGTGALSTTAAGDLWVVGALKDDSVSCVYRFDAASGTWVFAGELDRVVLGPSVSSSGNGFVVSSGFNLLDQGALAGGAELLTIQDNGTIESAPIDLSDFYTETGSQAIASAAVKDGYLLVGPECDQGEHDAYVLDNAGETSAYAQRASELVLLSPAAVGYDGKAYVLSRVQGGTENSGFIFVATDIATNPTPGDVTDPTDPTDPDVPNPPGGADVDDEGGAGSTLPKTGDDAFAGAMVAVAVAVVAILVLVLALVLRRRFR